MCESLGSLFAGVAQSGPDLRPPWYARAKVLPQPLGNYVWLAWRTVWRLAKIGAANRIHWQCMTLRQIRSPSNDGGRDARAPAPPTARKPETTPRPTSELVNFNCRNFQVFLLSFCAGFPVLVPMIALPAGGYGSAGRQLERRADRLTAGLAGFLCPG
jgi:hypothetical protein